MEISPSLVFFVTTPDKKTAMELANELVKKKITACANILENLTSVYWWGGKINTETKCMMILKTTEEKAQKVIDYIEQNHPYEVPECIGINITKGSPPYLQWITDSIKED